MLKLKGCTIRTHNFYSFKNLNLVLKEGMHYRICGPNGGGKTILAETIAQKTDITDGCMLFEFDAITNPEEWVKYVPARTFELLFNASDNVFYQQRYYSVANRDVQSVLDYLGEDALFIAQWKTLHPHFDISHLYPVKLTGLSNGQLRKLVLLKSMAKSPKILVMDYPYEGLDKNSREELNDLLVAFVGTLKCSLVIVDNSNVLPKLHFENIYVDNFTVSQPVETAKNEHLNTVNWQDVPSENFQESIIQCNNICVSYGEKKIVDNFSWHVKAGERWLLSGENGSGKSTILSLIFADHPQAYINEIYLWGKKRGTGESIWGIKNKISFLSAEMFTYASNSFKNNQKAEQFLYTYFQGSFEMEHVDLKALKCKAEKMLDYFQLNHIKQVLFRHLSSGQKQLLLIIRTFLFKKSLILLDEPFQFLDEFRKKQAKHFIYEQLTTKDTLIVISHHKELEFPGITHIKELKYS